MISSRTHFKTRNDLPEEARQDMIALLNQHLADLSDLYSQTKQAHWNVRGMNFIALHKLFDELAEAQTKFIDMLAERATALGGLAQGTIRQGAKHSRLPELDHQMSDSEQMLKAMADRYSSYGRMARQAIEVTENAGDMVSSDLFIELSGLIDQQLWFIEAHLQ